MVEIQNKDHLNNIHLKYIAELKARHIPYKSLLPTDLSSAVIIN